MLLTSTSFEDGKPIPERCAFGVRSAIDGHVLETATLTGVYSLNPDAR